MSTQSQTGDLLGRMFDRRYRVNELIGSGGMGSVYRATHLEMNREVALKVLERSVADTDKQVQRFYQEARASSRLQHPNTIRVFDFGRADDGRLYLAMEYLRGETLTELLKRQKRLSVDRSCHIVRQVCKSLAEAHQVGIIHRDLKPDNIFITDIYGERDFCKVLDFGIAKSTENDGQESLTQTGFICGTPRYLSPEQAMGKSIDARSDLYSVGVILYEMLSGHPPFSASTPIALVMKHIHEPPPRLPDGGKERAQWMSALVFGLMQKMPARRPSSSIIVSQALDDIARGLEPAGLAQRTQSVVPRSTPRARVQSVVPNRRRTATLLAGSASSFRRTTDGSSQASAPVRAYSSPNHSAPAPAGRGADILVDDPQDAVTSRGVAAMEDPQDAVTNRGVVAMLDPDEEPTRVGVAAMLDPDDEPTRVGVSAMVDPDDEPTGVGVSALSDSHILQTVVADTDGLLAAASLAASETSSRDTDDLAQMLGASRAADDGVDATIEEQTFAAEVVSQEAVGVSTSSESPRALEVESSGSEAASEPDLSNMTRVMQSPLDMSTEGLPVGTIDSGPRWPTYAIAAITVMAIAAGGVAWWQIDGRDDPTTDGSGGAANTVAVTQPNGGAAPTSGVSGTAASNTPKTGAKSASVDEEPASSAPNSPRPEQDQPETVTDAEVGTVVIAQPPAGGDDSPAGDNNDNVQVNVAAAEAQGNLEAPGDSASAPSAEAALLGEQAEGSGGRAVAVEPTAVIKSPPVVLPAAAPSDSSQPTKRGSVTPDDASGETSTGPSGRVLTGSKRSGVGQAPVPATPGVKAIATGQGGSTEQEAAGRSALGTAKPNAALPADTKAPDAKESAATKPAAKKSVAKKSETKKSETKKSETKKPVVKAAAKKPAAKKPAAKKPVAKKPVSKKPAIKKPVVKAVKPATAPKAVKQLPKAKPAKKRVKSAPTPKPPKKVRKPKRPKKSKGIEIF